MVRFDVVAGTQACAKYPKAADLPGAKVPSGLVFLPANQQEREDVLENL